MTERVVVVIPTHKHILDDADEVSIKQCVRILRDHPKILAHPMQVDGAALASRYGLDGAEAFPDSSFSSYTNYNRTIRSMQFYERFLRYDYILLHELDAFVFSDQLLEWCTLGYDYVGAPLGAVRRSAETYVADGYLPWWCHYERARSCAKVERRQLLNGGFALRKTRTLYWISRIWRKKVGLWGKNDDLFWSLAAPGFWPWLRLPTAAVAARFALMVDVQDWLDKADGELPFGCHGWPRYETDVWRPYLAAFGYRI
jgi:hypothetical protein